MAVEAAKAYLESKNVKGYPEKSLKNIGQLLLDFDTADKDKNGVLDRAEIKKILQKEDHSSSEVVLKAEDYGFASEADIDNYMKELDDDGNGKVDKSEFMQKIILRWANATYIRQLIKFDTEKDGMITADQIYQGLTDDGYTKEDLSEFIEKNDLAKDGKVDFKIFLKQFFDVNRK